MSEELNYDDPKVEEAWLLARRAEVERYLSLAETPHGAIADWPAWHLAPMTSVWAIESLSNPGFVGWWAVSGDHPTDYISSRDLKDPRAALRAICDRWKAYVETMGDPGKPRSDSARSELEGKLRTRIAVLDECLANDELWTPDNPSSA